MSAKCPGMAASQPMGHLREKRRFKIILMLPAKDSSLCSPPTGPDTKRGPVEGISGRFGWRPQDTKHGFLLSGSCWVPLRSAKDFLYQKACHTPGSPWQPWAALGSPRPQSHTAPAINKEKEAVCQPTLQNKAMRAGYRQPPPCQTQTHKV